MVDGEQEMSQMSCPNCGEQDNRTLETREHDAYNWVKRVRQCRVCSNRWRTLEINEADVEASE